ncbi:MAG: putative sulfate exporter family transporter [Desulfuromonadales bacterium]|nr:putative sulfate exporter family transporter [Desulfuromonadales bacterium]MBN2791132.1 putative sulfate exporter family transporter [Desulfuromonadales bacterium]
MQKTRVIKAVFLLCLLICFIPWVGTATALLLGIGFSFLLGNPWSKESAAFSKIILQVSVVGLGFGVSLGEVVHTGKSSLVYTLVGIALTLSLGIFLGRLLRINRNTSLLISFGTAICGGSAIAAMAPVIKAENEETAVSLATVFTLNSVALLLFPLLGHLLQLDQSLFGTWAGLAIHDTSSVVGAASAYGAKALAIGTTVKLTRTVWIAPVAFVVALLLKSDQRAKVPLFILGFVLAASIKTLVPQYAALWSGLTAIARQSLVVTLFLVGAGLSREVLKKVGLRPMLQGVALWLAVSSLTLGALLTVGLA